MTLQQPEGYDPAVDYGKIIQQWNDAVAIHDKPTMVRIMNEQGGIFALQGKWCYQLEMAGQLKYHSFE